MDQSKHSIMAIDIYISGDDGDSSNPENSVEYQDSTVQTLASEQTIAEKQPQPISSDISATIQENIPTVQDKAVTSIKLYQSRSAIMVRMGVLTSIFVLVWFLKFEAIDAMANVLNLGTNGVVWLNLTLSAVVIGIFILLSGVVLIAWRRTSYLINDEEVVFKSGAKIIRKRYEAATNKIGLITIEQGPVAKRLNYGKVYLNGITGPNGEAFMLTNVDDPYGVKAMIEKILGRHKKE